MPTCPLCDDDRSLALFAAAKAGAAPVVRCVGCGVAYREPPAAVPDHAPRSEGLGRLQPAAEALNKELRRIRARRLANGLVAGSALDVGCGQGRTLVSLRELGWKVAGVEIDGDLAQSARERGIPIHVGPLASHGFADGEFDLVTFFRVIGELARPADTLREARRILRPGGRLVVSVPNFGRLQERLFGSASMHLHHAAEHVYFDEASLRRLLESTGFIPQSERHFSLEDSPLAWLQSAENLALRNDNLLYKMLHGQAAAQPLRRAAAIAAGVLLSPAATTAAVVAAATGHGDFLEIIATRR